ncbi:HAMP domain-containing sensor histidine kinase [Cytophagaceae bacterium YF14B1]|uniref:histidine kinase n=1 Tax=Xanthocytophaga flava TaxID=3048013 RepID=A0AAE3QLH9_9BACT|nr:HAMP domain-containing sensor histidine kinase [Xanthocytophaga flavus]MDJ1480861.1 HAMP domain-containing sensor histidine kinase [Xanthocytophaga flavus]
MDQIFFIGGITFLTVLLVVLYKRNTNQKKVIRLLIQQNQIVRHQNEALQIENTRLERQHSVSNRLLAIISHDVRSPLHVIKGLVSLIEDCALNPDELQKSCTVLTTNLDATIHLVDNILHWSRSQINGIQSQPLEFDIFLLIEEVIHQLHTQAGNKQIRLAFIIETADQVVSNPVWGYADPVMIEIVIRNLLTNAIKFSESGADVIVQVDIKGDFIEVSVHDKGKGIAIEDQGRLFQMERLFSTAGTADEKGTGLGLAFCKELIEKNGGKIRCESVSGKGSTFFFTIPVKK